MNVAGTSFLPSIGEFFRNLYEDDPIVTQVVDKVRDLSQTISSWDSLTDQYFSVGGFFIGLVFLIFLFCANIQKEDHPIRGTIRILMAVAVVNSCSQLWELVLGAYPHARWYPVEATILFNTENIICGCVLTMVLHTTYRGHKWAGATFALITRLALLFLNYQRMGDTGQNLDMGFLTVVAVIQAVVLYFLGAIISSRKYFSTGWLWYTGYHFSLMGVALVLALIQGLSSGLGVLDALSFARQEYLVRLPDVGPTLVIFVLVLVVGILFDKSILSAGKKSAAKPEE